MTTKKKLFWVWEKRLSQTVRGLMIWRSSVENLEIFFCGSMYLFPVQIKISSYRLNYGYWRPANILATRSKITNWTTNRHIWCKIRKQYSSCGCCCSEWMIMNDHVPYRLPDYHDRKSEWSYFYGKLSILYSTVPSSQARILILFSRSWSFFCRIWRQARLSPHDLDVRELDPAPYIPLWVRHILNKLRHVVLRTPQWDLHRDFPARHMMHHSHKHPATMLTTPSGQLCGIPAWLQPK